MIYKMIVLLLFAISSHCASALIPPVTAITPANLTTENKLKCLTIIQPLVQDLAVKKSKIDECDGTISDLRAQNTQLQINLTVSQALAKEKEQRIADHQDWYTSYKNESLIKDELLTSTRSQIAAQATTIEENVKQIERLRLEAAETQKTLDQLKTQLEQRAKELQESELRILQLEGSLQEKNAQLQNVSAQLSIADKQVKEHQNEIDQLQNEKKEAEDQLSQSEKKQAELNKQLATEREENVASKQRIGELEKILNEKNNELDNLRKEKENVSEQVSICKRQQEIAKAQEADYRLTINRTQTEVNQLQSQLFDYQSTSCYGYGNTSGIRQIRALGIDPFEVACDSSIAGPGWTVIQRRINGTVNFYRNWTEYRNGFGDLQGEFFIGMEKLYRMTLTQTTELYIQLETFAGEILYARYTDFGIGSESEAYGLIHLGKYSGTAGDALFYSNTRKFSTYDMDNDRDREDNCAIKRKGAWWYDRCGLR